MLSINFGSVKDMCKIYCHGGLIGEIQLKGVAGWIQKRVDKYFSEEILNYAANNDNRIRLIALKELLNTEEIMEIISCEPGQLLNHSQKYEDYSDLQISYPTLKGKVKEESVLSLIFNYTAFREYKATIFNGFTLAEQLNIECCPYCNRNYTTTHYSYYTTSDGIPAEKRVYPEFDHFYCQADHPLLAVSFYNLVPSCTICNTHYKSNRNSSGLYHPYTLFSAESFKFKGFPKDVSSLYGAGTEISIGFEYNCSDAIKDQLINSHAFFGIKDIYDKCHGDLIKDIIYKKLAFGKRYMQELTKTYGTSFEDSYRIVFETYFEEENLHLRPFSKLKKDIFEDDGL